MTSIDYNFFFFRKNKNIFTGDQDSHRVEHAHQCSEAEANGEHGFHADLDNVKCITSCLSYNKLYFDLTMVGGYCFRYRMVHLWVHKPPPPNTHVIIWCL